MATDAHCHLFDLAAHLPGLEATRRHLNLTCAASAWNPEDWAYQAGLRQEALTQGAPRVYCCFGVHPQLPAHAPEHIPESLALLERLGENSLLDGVGETGFDLFSPSFKATEDVQERLFEAHLAGALRWGVPLVLHLRKAMHKIFPYTKRLKAVRAVVFHAYPGTVEDGVSLLRRGVNAYFSLSGPVLRGRKQTLLACAALPAERLLVESDAPYLARWEELASIQQRITALRREAGSPVPEAPFDRNFFHAYGP